MGLLLSYTCCVLYICIHMIRFSLNGLSVCKEWTMVCLKTHIEVAEGPNP
jgi:hypothetical protein